MERHHPRAVCQEVRLHHLRHDDHQGTGGKSAVLDALCRRQQHGSAARRGGRIKTADDLSGKTVGVQLGSAAAGIIKGFEAKLKAAGKPGFADIKQYEHYPEAYQDLLNKRIDAVVNSRSTMLVVMRDAPGKFKMIPGITDVTAYFGMAFRKEDSALRDFVNTQLGRDEGRTARLAKLQKQWFGRHDGYAEHGAGPCCPDHGRFRLGRDLVCHPLYAAGRGRHAGNFRLRDGAGLAGRVGHGACSAHPTCGCPGRFIRAYVYFVRGTPALVQIFLVYFALPRIGFEFSPFWSGVVALAFNSAGFIAEIVRASLQSIDAGQTEAALSIGMTNRQSIQFILLPQSLLRMTPPLTNEVITLVKSSSLLSVISITELTRSAQLIIAERFVPFELYAALAVYYLVIISVLSGAPNTSTAAWHEVIVLLNIRNSRRSTAKFRSSTGSIFRFRRRDRHGIGPSGAGKSTLLRCINRIEAPSEGDVLARAQHGRRTRHGKFAPDKPPSTARKRRRIGMVFQRFNLFAHLTRSTTWLLAPTGPRLEASRRA